MGSTKKRQVKRDPDSPPADENPTHGDKEVKPNITAKKAKGPQPYAPGAKSSLAEMIIKIGIAGLPSHAEVCEKPAPHAAGSTLGCASRADQVRRVAGLSHADAKVTRAIVPNIMKREADAEPTVKQESERKRKARGGEPCAEGARAALAQMIIDIGLAGLPAYDEVCEKQQLKNQLDARAPRPD
ncbi:hypothetical protein A1Q1_02435 [Trichosporon asahii var. asahii CBS 2479]|uniref:Uncharacterized protein n=1 Tax=Trichosporon asahii var. asahii (strain ATCC 90039 / CBS 2479 / JCM 2466 / KCTC 7840 / NBRC 103889/ NCYC 2677 / UAMH 7654) TaxID=1186058 RepID=J6F085_TRIAS|nr:hypothetical protein A1Q1_02435 [Trichosporon asahii var. asahii CBS 2479]EJT48527.1 hypothetical protein A1Q1_02435 [Trichosporon asahii var. asahii CBS 2479]